MKNDISTRLGLLREDYEDVAEKPFEHFYCPLLYRDEDVPLCKGHLVSQSFGTDLEKWVVQREDVDNFFGSRFEADFTTLRYRDAFKAHDVLGDRSLRRKLKPKVMAGDREVEYFIPKGQVPSGFTPVYGGDEQMPALVALKLRPDEVEDALDADWRVEVNLDLRVPTLVALLRSAHLTAFYILGYRYVLSPGGHWVGRTLLGKLFEAARDLTVGRAQEFAKSHLRHEITTVRPLIAENAGFQGTLRDGVFWIAWSSSGFPWALVVHVPSGDLMHSVMLPVGDHQESVATYHSFLSNDNESILLRPARFGKGLQGRAWEISKQTWRIRWPKGEGNRWSDEV